MEGVTRAPGVGDTEQPGRRRLGSRNPLTEGGGKEGKEVLGGQRETLPPTPQLPPELLTNPSGRASQSFPSGFRRVPADNEGPRRQLAREVPPRPLAELLAATSDPDRESHSSGVGGSPVVAAARCGQAPPGRGGGRPHTLEVESPVFWFPSPRGPTPLCTPNFLPWAPQWLNAAGRSPLGEEAERALG